MTIVAWMFSVEYGLRTIQSHGHACRENKDNLALQSQRRIDYELDVYGINRAAVLVGRVWRLQS